MSKRFTYELASQGGVEKYGDGISSAIKKIKDGCCGGMNSFPTIPQAKTIVCLFV